MTIKKHSNVTAILKKKPSSSEVELLQKQVASSSANRTSGNISNRIVLFWRPATREMTMVLWMQEDGTYSVVLPVTSKARYAQQTLFSL